MPNERRDGTAELTARPCPACGSYSADPAFVTHGYRHVRCCACDSLFVSPVPSSEEIQAVYRRPDYHANVEDNAPRMRQEARARAQELARRGCRSVLDLGCGAGYFLEACRDEGIDAEGVDVGPTAELAEQRGLAVHRVWLDEFEPSRTFDAIAAWELLEHLPDPLALLERAHRWIDVRGTLALSTPSATGLPARALGRRFPMITPPEHLELFSHHGLATLLTRGGFQPVRWTSFSDLDGDTLARGLQRYFLGRSRVAGALANAVSRVAAGPIRWLDQMGFGTSFEVYAVPLR